MKGGEAVPGRQYGRTWRETTECKAETDTTGFHLCVRPETQDTRANVTAAASGRCRKVGAGPAGRQPDRSADASPHFPQRPAAHSQSGHLSKAPRAHLELVQSKTESKLQTKRETITNFCCTTLLNEEEAPPKTSPRCGDQTGQERFLPYHPHGVALSRSQLSKPRCAQRRMGVKASVTRSPTQCN